MKKPKIDYYARFVELHDAAEREKARMRDLDSEIRKRVQNGRSDLDDLKERNRQALRDYLQFDGEANKAHGIWLRQLAALERSSCKKLSGRGR